MKEKKYFVIFIILYLISVSNIHSISKAKQIECLKDILKVDIGEMKTNNEIKGLRVLELLNNISTKLNKCDIEEFSSSKMIQSSLDTYIAEATKFDDVVYQRLSKKFAGDLSEKINNLISEIESSLNKINKEAAKKDYLNGILESDIKPLGNLADRSDIKKKLESIRDKLEDFNNPEDNKIKENILSKLEEFITEVGSSVDSSFSALPSEKNQKRSKYFSSLLQNKFDELNGGTGIKAYSGENLESITNQENSNNGTSSSSWIRRNAGVIFIFFLMIVLTVLDFIVIKTIIKGINADKIKSNIIDEVKNIIITEVEGIKAEIETVKDKVNAISFKTDIDALTTKVKDLENFVGEVENNILNPLKTKFDDLDEKNKRFAHQFEFINRKFSKMTRIIIKLAKEVEIEGEELEKERTEITEIRIKEQEINVVKALETKIDEMKVEKTRVEEQVEIETKTTEPATMDKKSRDDESILERKEDFRREEAETSWPEAIDQNRIPKMQFDRGWKKQIVEVFEKNQEKVMQFTGKIDQGYNINDWLLEIIQKIKMTISNDKESFFKDNVYPGLYAFASKISKSEFKELKDVFLNSLFEALDIEEFGRENDLYAPYMHDLLKDRGRTSGIIQEVFSPGYKLKSTGKIIIKAMVGL